VENVNDQTLKGLRWDSAMVRQVNTTSYTTPSYLNKCIHTYQLKPKACNIKYLELFSLTNVIWLCRHCAGTNWFMSMMMGVMLTKDVLHNQCMLPAL